MKKHYIIFLSVLAGVILIDLLTKIFLYDTASAFLPYLIGIRYAPLNTGAAWSFLSGHIWLFCLLAFVFIAAVIFFDVKFKTKKNMVYSLGIGFLLGGTIGNLIDRIALGGVRDFLFLEFWPTFPTFNFADVSLTVGCILIAVYLLFLYKPKGREAIAGVGAGEVKEGATKAQDNGHNQGETKNGTQKASGGGEK
ncbi:MAG: signal peptidase II [Christensenellaceae bacterium]|jgi:signal peptidase II|nr:signal peptidase II [Christensenellaceae bacterium]